jgi:hypothetical protein
MRRKSAVATSLHALRSEARKATRMLKGKIVDRVWRYRPKEIVIQFTDGSRLFVDMKTKGLEFSIT